MRKLPDWLQQDEALAASSKSHQYLQMNINSLRRLLGKMKQTTPAFKAKSSSWMRLVYFVCLAILITLSHSTIQLWILAIFLLAHIAFLPGEALLRLWKVLTRVLIFTAIVLLPRDLDSEWLKLATYITPNEHELSALYPNQSTEETLLANENKIIVTLGSKGVGYADNGEIHIVPGFKVEPVDTTGAGDTFNGAFATAIVNGKSLADALHYGNAAAALSIQRLGAQGGMPTKDEVAAFLAEHV